MAEQLKSLDPALKQFATPTQARYIDAINSCGSIKEAARQCGVDRTAVSHALRALRRVAALKGYAPDSDMTHVVADPFIVKGTSTYYDRDGKVRGQWVKTTVDQQRAETAMREAVAALAEDVPRARPVRPPAKADAELCTLYTLTDCHVGMRSWAPETGEDWDLDIAERVLLAAFAHGVEAAPRSAVGFVNQLGDFLHFDSLAPMTPTSGHLLDADGRYAKVIRTATRILRTVIDMALKKHERVVVLMSEGNHDVASSVWLRHLFSLLYEREPRVQVIDSEMPYYVHRHGQTMLAFHHGHLTKNERLPLLFAAQFPSIWGATTKRYCHVGHCHHVDEKEHAGMKVIQHPTIAARDAYASRHGYIAEREINVITYHARHGQVARTTVCPEMLELL